MSNLMFSKFQNSKLRSQIKFLDARRWYSSSRMPRWNDWSRHGCSTSTASGWILSRALYAPSRVCRGGWCIWHSSQVKRRVCWMTVASTSTLQWIRRSSLTTARHDIRGRLPRGRVICRRPRVRVEPVWDPRRRRAWVRCDFDPLPGFKHVQF